MRVFSTNYSKTAFSFVYALVILFRYLPNLSKNSPDGAALACWMADLPVDKYPPWFAMEFLLFFIRCEGLGKMVFSVLPHLFWSDEVFFSLYQHCLENAGLVHCCRGNCYHGHICNWYDFRLGQLLRILHILYEYRHALCGVDEFLHFSLEICDINVVKLPPMIFQIRKEDERCDAQVSLNYFFYICELGLLDFCVEELLDAVLRYNHRFISEDVLLMLRLTLRLNS